jgi:hypothetical protein
MEMGECKKGVGLMSSQQLHSKVNKGGNPPRPDAERDGARQAHDVTGRPAGTRKPRHAAIDDSHQHLTKPASKGLEIPSAPLISFDPRRRYGLPGG